ncbi:hypothetical protein JTE87_04341 [Bacillus amyloliquefaciens]|nr:hypothetical protein [Bacillus subtilis]MCB5337337.1 hypothetical protein [Bacillus amyloliquefaciens]
MLRGRNIRVIKKNNVERTTVGLVYNIYRDSKGYHVLDDFCDVLYVDLDCFDVLKH